MNEDLKLLLGAGLVVGIGYYIWNKNNTSSVVASTSVAPTPTPPVSTLPVQPIVPILPLVQQDAPSMNFVASKKSNFLNYAAASPNSFFETQKVKLNY
jgi:hypothetical protein